MSEVIYSAPNKMPLRIIINVTLIKLDLSTADHKAAGQLLQSSKRHPQM